MKQKPIYVEINIASDIETLWEYTQNPHLHKEWDLRFSDITYLHRLPDEPQRFLYETRIGFGLKVSGTGESIGDIRPRSSERVSSLAFASDHPLSLIKEGRGYWKYIERDNGQTAFLTQYQYETARGLPGSWIDRFLFRPLLSWATAWSFDALRLWIEQNRHPKISVRFGFVYVFMCLVFSLYWFFQGFHDGCADAEIVRGALETGLGVLWLLPMRRKWLIHTGQSVFFCVTALLYSGGGFVISLGVLTIAAMILKPKLPSAWHTKRKREVK
ncbi:hypothetical protein P9G40_15625 [Bacillus velezensis]|uniref:hypothetical protein n=1 Tax=Bacillus TaxID=1386 RepID=UPI0002A11CC4|nr:MULTISPECIES: hypothetical protein [Bacillus]AFZ90885.1 hypothetical protein B938_09325 [Bacillus velezensis AS43.3]AQP94534.1 hypothetical protein BZ167_00265 [Bacillus sp. 275]KYC90863.1 hypothetical protein B4140_1722 [Bacillus amyloliquefaciens]MCP1564088.1 hypothetical protein [Bacillus velezensis]MCX4184080.1 hypothetical protein [Bacillus amyloliquefaciens]